MKISVVCDNRTLDSDLASAWGFACLVGDDLLFDSGGDGPGLLSNLEKMGIDPAGIRLVVLSHAHGDHTGGLAGLLSVGISPTVYVPQSFPLHVQANVRSLTTLVKVRGSAEIRPGVHAVDGMGAHVVEQALAVETGEGLVVVTGCAHPGIVKVVRQARKVASGEVALVVGGFHLGSASRREIGRVISGFRDLGVRRVAPCHCTGDRAMRMFAEEYEADFVQVGVGRVITIGSGEGGTK